MLIIMMITMTEISDYITMRKCKIIPKPKIKQQITKPGREKSIPYTFSITIMHPPATIKCLGEEKTMCNLQQLRDFSR